MRLNKKGVTLIEIIVSVALISVVLVFLFRLLVVVKQMDDKSLEQLEYEEKTALIINAIQEQIKDEKGCTFSSININTLTINCPSFDSKRLELTKEEKEISVSVIDSEDDKKSKTSSWEFPENSIIDDLIKVNTSNYEYYKIDVYDSKGILYPIEIVYLDK